MGEYENAETNGLVGVEVEDGSVEDGKSKGFGAGAIAIAAAAGAGIAFGVSKLVKVIKRGVEKRRQKKLDEELAKREAEQSALDDFAANTPEE